MSDKPEALGIKQVRDVIIIGPGPAGYPAALYSARAHPKPAAPRPALLLGVPVLGGIDLTAVDQHFKGHMRPGRAAGAAHEGDPLILADGVADVHLHRRIVAVASDVAVAVVDLDQIPVAVAFARKADHAGSHRIDAGAFSTRKVNALVEGATASEGVGTIAKQA